VDYILSSIARFPDFWEVMMAVRYSRIPSQSGSLAKDAPGGGEPLSRQTFPTYGAAFMPYIKPGFRSSAGQECPDYGELRIL